MIMRKSIAAKFLTALFVVLFIGQAVSSVMLIFHTRAALLDSLERRIKRAASIAAGVSTGPLLSYDYSLIDTYVDEIMKDEEISSIHILDGNGKAVREKVRREDSDLRSINPFHFTKKLVISEPVIAGGSTIGKIVIDYNAITINENINRSMIMILLYQGIMFLTIGVVMVFLFNRNVKKPVLDINKAIEKITMGELTATVPDLGDNEVGSISKGVAFLAERLASTAGKLNSTAVNVSMAIKQVDVLYKNVTEGMAKQSNAVREIIKSIQSANKSQSEIIGNTEKLGNFSTENVSSLLEMKATAEEIASNTQRLYKATEDSYSVTVEMTQTAKVVSENSKEVVSAVEDTSASVEEIGASIKEVEEHARDSSRMAERVKEITSDTGMLSVVNAVEGMDNIADEVKRSAEIVQRLGTRSTDIEKVLSVIKDVTEQTNLLSLNAAILAAQAGEYGKSFSVVADEIRGLSERTATSTREIAGIVKTIQKDIKDAVNSIDNANTKVSEGNSLVVKVGDALKEILDASEHSADMTKAIERATQEQSSGLKQITIAVEEIRKMIRSIAKSTGEQEKSLSYLLEGAGEVKEVADISKRGTEEQAIGTKVITKNLELANEKITQINQSSVNQKKLNEEIISAMEQINTLGLSTVRDMEEVSNSLGTLFEEIEVLKKEMEVFRIR